MAVPSTCAQYHHSYLIVVVGVVDIVVFFVQQLLLLLFAIMANFPIGLPLLPLTTNI